MVIINTTGKQNQVWLDKPYGTVGCPDADEAYRSGFTAGVENQKSKLSSLSISGNGEYVSEDGVSAVTVDVPQEYTPEDIAEAFQSGVTEQKAKMKELFAIVNGVYDREDGWKRVTVDVPQTGQTINNQDKQVILDHPTFFTVDFPEGRSGWYTQEVIVRADSGYTGLGTVDAHTDFEPTEAISFGEQRQKEKLIAETFSANGIYDRADGWSRVVVDVPQTGHTDEEMEDSWNSGYTSGKTDAWQPAYDSGYTDGAASVDCQPLYDSGYTDGYSSGRTDGYDDGWRPGYASGYTDGLDAAGGDYASGYTDGFDAGYDSGVTDGYASGYTSGKTDGFGEGYDSGYTDGAASVDCQPLYDSGYTDGYESGHTDGYDERAAILTAMTITANGAYESVEGWSAVTVNVSGYSQQDLDNAYASGHTSGVTDGAAQQKALLSATAFTTNGTYTRTDGWSAVTVNVPQTGYTQQDLDNAYASGLTNGYDSGWTAGYDSGYTDGLDACSGVTPVTATSLNISVPSPLTPGQTGNVTVTPTPGDADLDLSYTSSDTGVATVDTNGAVTAAGTGTTDICVYDAVSQITTCATLTVSTPVTGSADVTAVVRARTSGQLTRITTENTLGNISKMAIDGTEITPVSAYTFGDTNPHTLEVWYLTTTVPYGAFEDCVSFENVAISDRMLIIGGRAFWDCTGITSVQIGTGVTNINNAAFYGCKSLTSVIVPDNVTFMGTNVFSTCTSLTSVTFGTGLSVIPTGTLKDCAALQSVTINGTVTELGNEAFRGCGNLNGVVLPNSLTTIGGSAFMDCGITSIQMPDNVASAGTAVFQGCTALTTVSISSGLSAITDNMFSGCSSLTGVVLPDTIQTIGTSAFYSCGHMTGITLSSGLTRIEDTAFRNCTYLRGIDIPATVVKIGAYSFQFDASLPVYGITVRNSVPCEIGSSAFASTDDAPIYVPAASVDTYKAASGWRKYADRIQAIQE